MLDCRSYEIAACNLERLLGFMVCRLGDQADAAIASNSTADLCTSISMWISKNQISTYPIHRSMINTHRSRCESTGNHKGAIPMRSHSDISAGVDFFETSMYMPAETLQAWLSVLWNCSLQPWQIPWIQKIQNNHKVDLISDLTDQSMSKHCMCTLILIVADATEQGKHQWSSMGGSGGEGKVENPAGKG